MILEVRFGGKICKSWEDPDSTQLQGENLKNWEIFLKLIFLKIFEKISKFAYLVI